MPNYIEYQQSISKELLSIKDRVRNFIDNHHWGEDIWGLLRICKDGLKIISSCNILLSIGIPIFSKD